jgi:hypothetical protein
MLTWDRSNHDDVPLHFVTVEESSRGVARALWFSGAIIAAYLLGLCQGRFC